MKNYKNIFPFSIGTTSYILHTKKNNLVANVEYLKKSFDKIQLLFFGKNYLNEVMSEEILRELKDIRSNNGIKYSIHLPIDLGLLNHESDEKVDQSLDVIELIIDKTGFLDVDNYILHIDKYENNKYKPIDLDKKMYESFEKILIKIKKRLKDKAKNIYIENVSYDLTFFKDIIIRNNFYICLDIGHLFIYKQNFDGFIKCFNERIKEVHLHGFTENSDHVSIIHIKKDFLEQIISFLKRYDKSVIIEVFNKKDLVSSIKQLRTHFS